MSTREGRTGAEWATFGLSCLILLILIALIAGQMSRDTADAAPIAHQDGPVRVVRGQHFVDVEVTNEGDVTASNVQVNATLMIDGATTTADQTIDFLSGGEVKDLVFVFADAPSNGTLDIVVSSFGVP